MARQEAAKFKPTIEFYIDKAMGLCVVTTKPDGRQGTKQYLKPGEAEQWLTEWLTTPEVSRRVEGE